MTVRWYRRTYTPDQFRDAWNSSLSLRQVAIKLGKNAEGGMFYGLRSAAEDLGLTDEHMVKDPTALAHQVMTIPLADILVEHSTYTNTDRLRKRLIAAGLKKRECEICGITEWLGCPAPVALDHINGVRQDNRIENGLTPTYGSKNFLREEASSSSLRGSAQTNESDHDGHFVTGRGSSPRHAPDLGEAGPSPGI